MAALFGREFGARRNCLAAMAGPESAILGSAGRRVNTPRNNSLVPSTLVTLVEVAARAGAVLSLFGLTTAFLYDFIFWSVIDVRLLGYFVLSDHIETAVAAVGGALLFLIFAALVVGSIWFLVSSFRRLRSGIVADASSRRQAGGLLLPAARWLLLIWIIIVCAIALGAEHVWPTNEVDTVTLQSFATVSGRILRTIEKGVILRGDDGRIVFLPKEQIIRVDQRAPK